MVVSPNIQLKMVVWSTRDILFPSCRDEKPGACWQPTTTGKALDGFFFQMFQQNCNQCPCGGESMDASRVLFGKGCFENQNLQWFKQYYWWTKEAVMGPIFRATQLVTRMLPINSSFNHYSFCYTNHTEASKLREVDLGCRKKHPRSRVCIDYPVFSKQCKIPGFILRFI